MAQVPASKNVKGFDAITHQKRQNMSNVGGYSKYPICCFEKGARRSPWFQKPRIYNNGLKSDVDTDTVRVTRNIINCNINKGPKHDMWRDLAV